jgi:adenine deaminase
MATLNAAEHFHIDCFVGGIAPGKFADIVIIPDLKTIKAEYVISNGNIVAENKAMLIAPRKSKFPRRDFPSIDIHRKLKPADFAIQVNTENKRVKVRIMDLVTNLITREAQLDLAVTDGEINMDPDNDILKIAVITTNNKKEKIFTGLVKGFGIGKGALASSAVWDTCALLVVGADEKDMAEAANRLIALRGGIAVCADGKVEAELALPFGGILSDQPIETIVQKMDLLQRKMVDLGCSLPDAHMSLTIFTGPAIPFLRISEEGLVDTRKGKIVDLIVPD